MKDLHQVIDRIKTIEDSTWEFSRKRDHVNTLIENFAFRGLYEKNILFFDIPVSAAEPKTHIQKDLLSDSIKEYFETGDISDMNDYILNTWITGRIDFKKRTIRIYQTPFVSDKKTPRENYIDSYLRIKEFHGEREAGGYTGPIYEFNIDSDPYKKTWDELIKAVEFIAKNPRSEIGRLDNSTSIIRTKWYIDFNRRIKDDQYEESSPRQTINIANTHYSHIKLPIKCINSLNGADFEEPYFSYEKVFANKNDCLNFLFSAVEWVNTNTDYRFTELEKTNISNQWPNKFDSNIWSPPVPENIPPGNPPAFSNIPYIPGEGQIPPVPGDYHFHGRYGFRCGKCNGVPLVEAKIEEDGSVFLVKNHEDGGPIYFEKLSDGR
jgi:hypothetical protein